MDLEKREKPTEKCPLRTEWQRDRDKIIHAKSFRRLMHKTQVFIAPKEDHYRTRLTHTLEVSQIARTIARESGLNEDLTEAISLGHDLGHTPFGHTGERALNEMFRFRHNEQSLRVVEKLENKGEGLNLTFATRNGILCHSKNLKAKTKEGLLVNISDRIAYINHDIDDALRAKIINFEELPKDAIDFLGKTHSERITKLVTEMVDFYKKNNEIGMQKDVENALMKLREFMFDRVYLTNTQKEQQKANDVVKYLYTYFLNNEDKIPSEYKEEVLEVRVCDFVASMTDRYALDVFKSLVIPRNFEV